VKLEDMERGWIPPDGLGYSGLRPVRLTPGGWVLAVVAAIFMLGGPVLGVYLWNQSQRQGAARERLDREGVAAQAAITRLWRTGGKSPSDRVSYRFEDGTAIVTGTSHVPSRTWRTLHVGDTLPVRYVPADPSINHPAAWPMDVTPDWLSFLIAAILIGEAGLILFMLWRQWYLLGEGRPAPGVVLDARRVGSRSTVRYEFRALSGAVLKGRCRSKSPAIPGEGSAVCVLYDPENPKRNAMYPFQLVRLEGARKKR
jgi:Protein of unknown function (DUF3592)